MASDRFPSDAAEKFMLRLPDGMRDQIAGAAKANQRSMNSEIVGRLAASFEGKQDLQALRSELQAAWAENRALKQARQASDTIAGMLARHMLYLVERRPRAALSDLESKLIYDLAKAAVGDPSEEGDALLTDFLAFLDAKQREAKQVDLFEGKPSEPPAPKSYIAPLPPTKLETGEPPAPPSPLRGLTKSRKK